MSEESEYIKDLAQFSAPKASWVRVQMPVMENGKEFITTYSDNLPVSTYYGGDHDAIVDAFGLINMPFVHINGISYWPKSFELFYVFPDTLRRMSEEVLDNA